MLTINTNLSSLIAQGSMKSSTNKLNQAIERMTTGFKINHAKDNAANYSISTNMTTKIGAYNVAEDNAAMGLDLISTAEGTLSQIEDKLQRLRALAEQAANGTYGEQSLNAINAEANALVDEIERIYNNSEYNGINLMKGRVVGTEESKFIKDIDRRDTSKMTTLASVDENEKLEYGTYSISTAEELAKLATMTRNQLIGNDTEFVLANDIDLSGYDNWVPIGICMNNNPTLNPEAKVILNFGASFDGNGFVVKNLKINRVTDQNQALFGCANGATIRNLGVEEASVKSKDAGVSACLVAFMGGGVIENCYTEGEILSVSYYTSGILGQAYGCVVKDCYADISCSSSTTYSGVVGGSMGGDPTVIENCHVLGTTSAMTNIFTRLNKDASVIIKDCTYNSYYDTVGLDYTSKPWADSSLVSENISTCDSRSELYYGILASYNTDLSLQVGIDSSPNSQISIDYGYLLDSLSILRRIGTGTGDYLTLIDKLLAKASEKQTHFGATSNRLESVLEEITIQRDNLVSSRSTIRDADIAEVSSHYIQQQILQQASATLLATANQSPAIALQLI